MAGSTGNVFPTVGANVDRAGSTAWTNPGDVVSDNTTDATVVVPSDYLVTSGYGFAIPATCRILGVTVRVEASESGTGSSSYVPQLHSATTPTLIGAAKSAVTVTGTTKVISSNGGTADLWSAALTPAIVNAAGFGVSIWSTDTINTLAVDFVTIAIEYGEEAPWLTGRETFRRRRKTTNRRLIVVELDEFQQAAGPSADRALEAPFRTVVLRSRRSQSVGWIAALTAQVQSVPPVSAWLVPTTFKRRETVRKTLTVEPLHWPYIAPEMAAILPVPTTIVRVQFRRKLQEQAPQVVFPPPTGPPSYYPAWAARQLPATFQDRRLLQALDAPVYPETPKPEPNLCARIPGGFHKRKGTKRRLLTVELDQFTAAPGGGVSADRALEPGFVTRTIRSRKLQRVPALVAVASAAPQEGQPVTAVTPSKTKRRKHRQGLFLSGGGVVEARVQPQYPSYAVPHPKKRKSTERRLLRSPELPSSPATPAVPAQPVTAWQAPKQHRIERERTLQKAAPQITHPATPAVAEQPLPAWALPKANRIDRERTRRDVPRHEAYPVTPVYAANQLVEAIKRRETKRRPRVSAHEPSYPGTPAAPQAPTAFKLAEGFRRHGWRKLRGVLEIDLYPDTPEQSKPTTKKTHKMPKPNRTLTVKRPDRTLKTSKPERMEKP